MLQQEAVVPANPPYSGGVGTVAMQEARATAMGRLCHPSEWYNGTKREGTHIGSGGSSLSAILPHQIRASAPGGWGYHKTQSYRGQGPNKPPHIREAF